MLAAASEIGASMSMLKHLAILALTALSVSGAMGASPCEASEHRAFDFWLGEWQVRTPDGKLAGVNRISSEYNGCVLHERYDTRRGYSGESLNAYDAGRKVWHQTWVDTSGTLHHLDAECQRRREAVVGVHRREGPKDRGIRWHVHAQVAA
jgi:hypothetical protein